MRKSAMDGPPLLSLAGSCTIMTFRPAFASAASAACGAYVSWRKIMYSRCGILRGSLAIDRLSWSFRNTCVRCSTMSEGTVTLIFFPGLTTCAAKNTRMAIDHGIILRAEDAAGPKTQLDASSASARTPKSCQRHRCHGATSYHLAAVHLHQSNGS
jgi:hypothetical protein